MSLNDTPSAERIQIGIFGRTNAGKSALINALTGQNISIVSDKAGTTTDLVKKSMELPPLGAVSFIDTAGYNDNSELGAQRTAKTFEALSKIDIAIVTADAVSGLTGEDKKIIKQLNEKNIKYIIAYNKCDIIEPPDKTKDNEIYISALKNINIDLLKEKLGSFAPQITKKCTLTDGLVKENDIIILVTPIDSSAPKGRLILPQQQVIRDILDKRAVCITVQESQLEKVLKIYSAPKLVITDSQVFKQVKEILPANIPLTSFSILFARYKGVLDKAVKGAEYIEQLKNQDTVLISEGCTHKRQCGDIGTIKLPALLMNYTKKKLNFEFSSGGSFPDDLSRYSLIIHCGGCMLNDREVLNRYSAAEKQGVNITNYGTAISYMNGILSAAKI